MKALILNSGRGSRMGTLTARQPKCMTQITGGETVLSRQLRLLSRAGITEAVMTTGYADDILMQYCKALRLPMRITFVKNLLYDRTNYIYSIYCAREYLDDDLLLLHGDLVFDSAVPEMVCGSAESCMTVSTVLPLPEKDFKAKVLNGKVLAVGVDIYENAVAAQAFYKLNRADWRIWLDSITAYCDAGKTGVYAEDALNVLNGAANISALDVRDLLCAEIDNPADLAAVCRKLERLQA